jgi:hypothetical protein
MSKPSDDQLSPGHTEAIGRLVVGVSKVDILLTDLIAVFLRSDSVSAAAAVHHQQVANKIDTLRTLVKLRHWPDGDPEILELLSKVKGVNDYRNTIVHGHWVVDKAAGETYVVRFKTRGEFKRPRSAVTVNKFFYELNKPTNLRSSVRFATLEFERGEEVERGQAPSECTEALRGSDIRRNHCHHQTE